MEIILDFQLFAVFYYLICAIIYTLVLYTKKYMENIGKNLKRDKTCSFIYASIR